MNPATAPSRSASVLLLLLPALLVAADWPQFRGPNASGVSDSTSLPTEFGPRQNVVWKTPLPSGHSSPALAGDRIFITAYEGDKLLTLCLDRATLPLWAEGKYFPLSYTRAAVEKNTRHKLVLEPK